MNELSHYGVKGMKWGRRKARHKGSGKLSPKEKAKILKSPTRLYRNRDKFSQDEISNAMKRMRWERELRQLSQDEISMGAKYAQAVLAYGTAATLAYNFYSKIRKKGK